MSYQKNAAFEGVKVKDKVYDIALGWGEVVKLENRGKVDFLVRFVDRASNTVFAQYNFDGEKHKYAGVFDKRTLYWNVPIIQETEKEEELSVKGLAHMVESGRLVFTSDILASLSKEMSKKKVKVQKNIEIIVTLKYKG